MTLDRTQAPQAGTISEISLLPHQIQRLSNGITVHSLNAGSQDVLRVELIFDAGIYRQNKILQAGFTGKMLAEGAAGKSGKEIAEAIDFLGAFIQYDVSPDASSIALYVMRKHLKDVLPILKNVATQPSFPAPELETLKANRKQRYRVSMEKVGFLAKREVCPTFLGPDSPYSFRATESDYDNITVEDLKSHFETHYSKPFDVLVSGKFSEEELQMVSDTFASLSLKPSDFHQLELTSSYSPQRIHIPKEGAMQSAILIGKPFIRMYHPDYAGTLVLNTILGGYFGSRLMSNIREDKGYTYGIYSSIAHLRHASYLRIGSEVGLEVSEKAIEEIFKEIRLLSDELVSDKELDTVRNYLLGNMLKDLDGPFSQSDRYWHLYKMGLSPDSYYKNVVDTIKQIQPEQIRELARHHFPTEQFSTITAGGGESSAS